MDKKTNERRCDLIRRDVYLKDLDWFENQELIRLQHIMSAEIAESMRPQMAYLTRDVMAGLFQPKVHGLNERAMEVE